MNWIDWVLIALGIYVVIGTLVAMVLMSTPYSENGWLQIMLMLMLWWPLYVLAMFVQ